VATDQHFTDSRSEKVKGKSHEDLRNAKSRSDLGHPLQKDMWRRINMEKVVLENLK
jgi:hypothetical protein